MWRGMRPGATSMASKRISRIRSSAYRASQASAAAAMRARWRSVTDRQRLRIAAAAEVWLAQNADDRIRDIRFDAMLVAPGRIPRHIPAAFDAGG